jgi:hypothetical protein
MDNLREPRRQRGMRHAKTDSGKHIDNINKVSGPSNRSALIMRTSCPGRAHALSDSGTVVPILEMHFEIAHAIARDIKLGSITLVNTTGQYGLRNCVRTFPGQSRHLTRHSCSPLGAVRIAISNLSSGYFAFIAACATISVSGGRSYVRRHQAPVHVSGTNGYTYPSRLYR